MKYLLLQLSLWAVVCVTPSCDGPPHKTAKGIQEWRSIAQNGDKAAYGISLRESPNGDLSGRVYVFTPDGPFDFSPSKALPTSCITVGKRKIKMTVQLGNGENDEFYLQIKGKRGDQMLGDIVNIASGEVEEELMFVAAK